MKAEMISLGASLDQSGVFPPIGGEGKLFLAGDHAVLFDFGVYPSDKRKREKESQRLLQVERREESIKLDDRGFPDLSVIEIENLGVRAENNDSDFSVVSDAGLPNYKLLRESLRVLKRLTIVATHGHADHIGALPWLYSRLRRDLPALKVDILMTAPTREISEWSWNDHLKVVENNNSRIGRQKFGWRKFAKPLYGLSEIEAVLGDAKIVDYGDVVACGQFELKFFRNPHILGAVSVRIKISGVGECAITGFVTGDVRYKDQRLIHGMPLPTLESLGVDRLDFLLMESTYAGKSQPAIVEEEKRLVADIKECVARGGKFLIGSLAINRAQTLFDICVRHGITEMVPVWLDGAAQRISEIYNNFLPGSTLVDVAQHFVRDRGHRRDIMNSHEPCVVIASSGMFVGGPSVAYASVWARDARNMIATASWQDPYSPGGRLSGIKNGSIVSFDGKRIRFLAEVKRYHPSSHMDGAEALQTIGNLRPARTFLAHGEETGMNSIIGEFGSSTIVKTEVGRRYDIA